MNTEITVRSQSELTRMRRAARALFAVTGLVLFLTSTALAVNRGPLNLFSPVLADGRPLPPGMYRVQWTGTGPKVQLGILREGKVIAIVPAEIKDIARPEPWDSVILTPSHRGKQSLLEIHFAGRRYVISLPTNRPSGVWKDTGN